MKDKPNTVEQNDVKNKPDVENSIHFQKLTPNENIKLDAYEEALEFVFSSPDIKNIALTGVYGAGKTSVMNSYEKKHGERKFMHVSFAHFQDEIASNCKEGDKAVSLEGKIINHLIRQIPYENIRYSRFSTMKNSKKVNWLVRYSLVCLFAMTILYNLKFDSWTNLVNDFDSEYTLYGFLSLSLQPGFRLFAGLFSLVLGAFLFNRCVKLLSDRLTLTKLYSKNIEL